VEGLQKIDSLPIESQLGTIDEVQVDRKGAPDTPLSDPAGFKVLRWEEAAPHK
jgi:hypothetical protein